MADEAAEPIFVDAENPVSLRERERRRRADERICHLARWSILGQVAAVALIQGGRHVSAAMQVLAGLALWIAALGLALIGIAIAFWNVRRVPPRRFLTAVAPWLLAAGLIAALIVFY